MAEKWQKNGRKMAEEWQKNGGENLEKANGRGVRGVHGILGECQLPP